MSDSSRTVLGLLQDNSEDEFDGFTAADLRESSSSSCSSVSDVSDSDDVSDEGSDDENGAGRDANGAGRTSKRRSAARVDLSSGYDYRWLKNFTEKVGPLIHDSNSSEFDVFTYFFLTPFCVHSSSKPTGMLNSTFKPQYFQLILALISG